MKIAIYHPYRAQVAERESFMRVARAAASIGHEAVECHDDKEIFDCAPDFVLSFTQQCAKLTKYPTYALISSPRRYFAGIPRLVRNILTYDALFTLSPVIMDWYRGLCDAARKQCNILPFTVTCHMPHLPGAVDFRNLTAAYTGTNWDGLRLKECFERLAESGEVFFYGPPEKWRHLPAAAVKGRVEFDGESLLTAYRQHGVGLALGGKEFIEDEVSNNRCFEIAAAGALVISARYPQMEEWYGDSVLYVDQEQSPEVVAREILGHIRWARENPADAASMADRAHRIFQEKLSLEKMLANAVAFHEKMVIAKRYVMTDTEHANGASIGVIVRSGEGRLESIRRSLDSIVAQTFPQVAAVLVVDKRPDGFEALLASYEGKFALAVTECTGKRSAMLKAGLESLTSDYFAVLDEGDEIYPNHFMLLLDRIAYFKSMKNSDVLGVYSGSAIRSEHDDLYEHSEWRDEHLLPGGRYFCVNDFEASDSRGSADLAARAKRMASNAWLAHKDLLDPEILKDRDIEYGEDKILLHRLLEKASFEFNYELTACIQSRPTAKPGQASAFEEGYGNNFELRQIVCRHHSDGSPPSAANAASAGDSSTVVPTGTFAALPKGFDPARYLQLNPDVANAKIDAAEHYRQFGYREGRRWR